ncbi:hypothetical protein [Halococcus qingdaonensis]|uniref:hypothetical protein n=1 Tax=Halococcus qingdaonensis TaxID=224402 RepID=UPI00211677E6|nr:hypothetical protein [Halococcus qingdaonensis]
MEPPRGIFGIPHGLLSSPDEWAALGIGLLALAAATLYDGDLDLEPVSGAAIVGIVVALLVSFIAPSVVTNEWHVPVIVVLAVIAGVIIVHQRG